MSKKQVYWGVFLITIGGFLLIHSFGMLNCDFSMFIRLWPMFFIFWGISLLKLPDLFKKILSAKKVSSDLFTIYYTNKDASLETNKIHMSFVSAKKLGNAVKRNKIK